MLTAAVAVMALAMFSGATELSGCVRDEQGQALGGARVFLEEGMTGPVREGSVSPDGRFYFDEILPGQVGVFAVAEGYGFGGMSLTVGVEDRLSEVSIALRPAVSKKGKVKNARGDAVAGARFTRLLLLAPYKVGIPLAKLVSLGFDEPVSGKKGGYVLDRLPRGVPIGVKVAHPLYAQEAAVFSGDHSDVVLYKGVLVQGDVFTRGENRAVSNARVIIKNAQPPHDTAITRTDNMGAFSIRLKPGVYIYHSEAKGLRSPGGQQLRVLGDRPQPRARLFVAGAGEIVGTVQDAITGEPVENARLTLHTDGHLAAITRTGPTGLYHFAVTAGESVVRLANAPGYLPPETQAYRVSVAEGQRLELAGLFLAPIPSFRLRVVRTDGETPADGAVVTLLRPQAFGWQVADAEGWVELKINAVPDDGRIVGMVEHPGMAAGALFALSLQDSRDARVQLLPWCQVSGHVSTGRGKDLAGVRIEGVYPGKDGEGAVVLWRTVSRRDGIFRWPAVLPGVPQRCVVRGTADLGGESRLFNLPPQGSETDVRLVLDKTFADTTLFGETLSWRDTSGNMIPVTAISRLKGKPAVVFFCRGGEVKAVLEGIAAAERALGATPLAYAVVVRGGVMSSITTRIPVLAGESPGPATTYVVNGKGKVILETFDMPPAHFLGAAK